MYCSYITFVGGQVATWHKKFPAINTSPTSCSIANVASRRAVHVETGRDTVPTGTRTGVRVRV